MDERMNKQNPKFPNHETTVSFILSKNDEKFTRIITKKEIFELLVSARKLKRAYGLLQEVSLGGLVRLRLETWVVRRGLLGLGRCGHRTRKRPESIESLKIQCRDS